MSSLRITQNSMNRTQMTGLNTSLGRLQQTQEQLTTGKRISRPSDDPVGTVSALRFRGQQAQIDQFGQNIEDGLARLTTADNALTQTMHMVQRIRTISVAAANGTNGPEQRAAYAKEIRELRQGIIQQANTQYADQPVFGGTTPGDRAFDPATGEFVGNNYSVVRQVTDAPGDAGQVNVAVNGVDAFGKTLEDGGTLDALATAIENGDHAGMSAGIAAMDDMRKGMLDVASTVGARVNRLKGLEELNGRSSDSIAGALSKVEDTDFQKAAMDLAVQSASYQAALAASAKVIQPSLMDFLR